MKFDVWAPSAKSVELVIGERRIALRALDGGCWQGEAQIGADEGYRYSLDGGAPLPDPRSRWQRDGVHGPSYVVDAAALRAAGHADETEFRSVPPIPSAQSTDGIISAALAAARRVGFIGLYR